MINKKYEISIWEDYIVPANDGIPEHYEERKIAVIGSDTMTAQCRAIQPKLVENINGTNVFTFKMYYTYLDAETGEKYQNPFLNLLVNERKIKVLWKDKWYDLIIKGVQEDSNGKSITYTCKDIFINELSKTGFEIIFDTEKENDINTLEGFAAETLKGSDWSLGNIDNIPQEKEEPVYEVLLQRDLDCLNQTKSIQETIKQNEKILVFYNQIQNIINSEKTEDNIDLQFAYATSFSKEKNSQLVVNSDCYSKTFRYVKQENNISFYLSTTLILSILINQSVSTIYRAKRLVENFDSVYDKKIDRYVEVYTDGVNDYYKFTSSEFKSPSIVGNIFTNSKDFKDTSGWVTDNNSAIYFGVYSPDASDFSKAKSYLSIEGSKSTSNLKYYLNSGLSDTLFLPEGAKKGQKFVFRYRARNSGASNKSYIQLNSNQTKNINIDLKKYSYTNDRFVFEEESFFSVNNSVQNGDWVEFVLTCNKGITKSQILSGKYGIILTAPVGLELWIEDIQLFEEIYGDVLNQDGTIKNQRINPNDYEVLGKNIVKYNYYNPKSIYTSVDDLEFLYSGTEDWNNSNLTKKSLGFTKKRKISIKNSNRFNILQTLAESFECWVRFNIEHDQNTGRIIYENGIPKKSVTFLKDIGKETGIGFIYGQDLKTISRKVVSDQIVTKTIVSPNSNEYAENGSCDIRASSENYGKTNFILDFGYYINQGLLDGGQINKDLYLSIDSIGYFFYLEKYYNEYLKYSERLVDLKENQQELKSLKKTYEIIVSETLEGITSNKSDFKNLTNLTYNQSNVFDGNEVKSTIKENAKAFAIVQKIVSLQSSYDSYSTELERVSSNLDSVNQAIVDLEENQKQNLANVENKNKEFFNKYSRFIQEGSWISEDYTDPNLYYLDAQNIAYTSSRPQITYNISAMRLSDLEEYKNKVFNVGDISFIQDTEFFGYEWIDSVKTPYREKVLISEVTSNFDSSEQDSFKIQNYKTQFEDLFQRITATTQSLQYNQAGYQKAANAFTETGTIKFETLQNSIAANQELVFGAKNESITQDETGLTVTDLKNPNNKTKVTSGGIFVTTDGGKTWKGAVKGEGVSTQYLTTGSINTSNIFISSGEHPTFRWDSLGINAYGILFDQGQEIEGIVTDKFVRFDRFGIYGIQGVENFVPQTFEEIKEHGSFGLSWGDFFLKSKHGNGYVSISSTDDFVVFDGNVQRVKIGALEGTDTYGMILRNQLGNVTLKTGDDGNLWLSDKITIELPTGREELVQIGNLGYEDSRAKVFDANGNFKIFSDGRIEAKSGTIGNLSIAEFEETIEGILNVNITSSKIEALINNKILSFSDQGLSLVNSGFEIYKEEYYSATFDTSDNTKKFKTDLDYYIFTNSTDENGNTRSYYEKISILKTPEVSFEPVQNITSFNSEKQYFEIDEFTGEKKLTEDITPQTGKTYYIGYNIPVYYINNNGTYKEEFIRFFLEDQDYYTKNGNAYTKVNKYLAPSIEETYYNRSYEKVFYFDENSKNLTLKGTIVAENGSFKGEIQALSGIIGGFYISNNQLLSKEGLEEVFIVWEDGITNRQFNSDEVYYELINNSYQPTKDLAPINGKAYYTVTYKSSLELNGKDGIIKVNNIYLGTGAKIEDYISFGNNDAWICNPQTNNGIFIKTKNGNIEINAEQEILKLGEISLDGINSQILGNNFIITPDWAEFSNVTVSGKITSSIFETGHTSIVGGSMVFKDAIKVNDSYYDEAINKTVLILDRKTKDKEATFLPGNVKRYITYIEEDGSIEQNYFNDYSFVETENEENIRLIISNRVINKIKSIIILGSQGSAVISINSEDITSPFFEKRGLTMSELVEKNGKLTFKTKSYLGDLEQLGYSGYGLYSDNVVLRGSLITFDENGNSAGISTSHEVNANIFTSGKQNDSSRIVFWAGAEGTAAEQIQRANFQVTQNGSIYASQGFFEDSIIARSKITGADIYAARLHGAALDDEGYPTEQSGTLTIYDTAEGIIFKTGFNKEEKEIFSINTEGLRAGQNNFISIIQKENNFEISFSGQSFETEIIKPFGKNNSYIKLLDSTYEYIVKENIVMSVGVEETKINSNKTIFANTLMLGDEETNIEFKKVNGGYDLYVYGS